MYYSCQRQAPHARGSGGMPPRKILNYCSSEMAFWANLTTNMGPAIAIHITTYILTYKFVFLNNLIKRTLSFSL